MKKKEILEKIKILEDGFDVLQRRISCLENTKTLKPILLPHTYPEPFNGNMVCPYCLYDSGWSNILCMVIPPEGLRCMNCGRICIYGTTVTCESYTQTHPQYTIETKPISPNTVVCGCEGCGGYHGCEEPFPSNERLPN